MNKYTKYIGVIIMLAICVVLDIILLKGLGTDVPEHRKEELWQSFTGTVVDWVCLFIINALWLTTSVMQVLEVEVYAKRVVGWVIGFLGISIVALLLIRFA